MKRSRWPLWLALAFIVVGLIGLSAGGIILARSGAVGANRSAGPRSRADRIEPRSTPRQRGDFSSLGEQIYYTGTGHAGPIRITMTPQAGRRGMMRRWGPSGGGAMMGCVECHGTDGRGGSFSMMGVRFEVPDIRYSALTSPHTDDQGKTEPAWIQSEIEAAIRDGVEPSGDRLDGLMPRWDMDDTDMAATIDYLKELGRQ